MKVVTVRAEAARLLGLFERVSDSFLDQTLDKKLLNTMRFTKESDRDSRKAFHKSQQKVSSQWSTGKKLGEDIPAEKIEEEQTSMISIGACGAFVTALEDEFMVVRQAGVYSLGKLAADRPFFAADAIDHLADMFNDEIEEVRLDAVRALTPLVVHGVLQKEQLDTILTVLDDALPDSREALRILLGKSTLASVECLRFCVEALLNCLRRFPIDRSSIYLLIFFCCRNISRIFRCLSQLGRRHASFVQSMVYDLLELNPVFDITERSLEDYMYLAKLIFILNAASIHEPICSLLPEFAVRHYRYLRCSMSNLVPDVPTFSTQDSINGVLLRSPMDDNKETRTLLERSYEVMLEASMAESYEQRMVLQKFILKDLVILYEANEKIASTARFLSKLMHCFTCHDLIIQMITFGGDLLTTLSVIEEGLLIIDYAENEFHSVDNVVLSSLAECAFRLRILRFALQLERKPSLYQNAVDAFAVEIDFLKRRLSFLETTPSKSIMKLIDEIMEQIEYSETKKFVTCPGLTSLLQTKVLHLPHQFPSLGKIFMKWAEMVEPCETPSEPIRFIAGLPLAIPLNILLHNFNESDLRNFRIKVDYPDQTSNLFRPRQSDFKEISSQKVRLLCKVLVQSSAWSDAARVRLSCVLILPDRPFIHLMQDNSQFDIKDTQTRCISISVSPHSTKESSIDIPVYPMFGKAW
ncbi:unnamed protein product [Dracunculus medinensis]|uniref:Integrator complex subunit 4/Protein SIEL C-terminal Ig-like domain-containing protein n=1 Tax=Dracunculus medinensis TaxID=318479 RepID=A0A3P7PTU0_DRAME|nr:unnamed protein product [Dracunculus medinensis]